MVKLKKLFRPTTHIAASIYSANLKPVRIKILFDSILNKKNHAKAWVLVYVNLIT